MTKPKSLPTNPMELKKLLEKLKDEEIKLEADLAIKKNPEIEDGIVAVIVHLSEVKRLDRILVAVDKPQESAENRADTLDRRRRYFESKLADAKEMGNKKLQDYYAEQVKKVKADIRGLAKDAGHAYLRLRHERQQAVHALRSTFADWTDRFQRAKFDLDYFLPALPKILAVDK